MKRHFSLLTLLILTPLCLLAAHDELRVDGERLNRSMEKMRSFGQNEQGGSDRVAYSDHNADALGYLSSLMRNAGLTVQVDVAGNLVGHRDGSVEGLAPIVIGSHIDTVPNGGHYDGIVGVMAAIEVAQSLFDANVNTDHPLQVVAWSNEEGGKTGSRSWKGDISERELELTALGERSMGEGMRYLGGDPERLAENRKDPGDIAGYVELHVEQGAVLDRQGVAIGIVEGIVGIRRWNITVTGFANHAGTTPMDQRQDAMYTAALVIADIRRVITERPGTQVGTVGRLEAFPGAPNVIPGEVVFSLEIRDLDMQKVGSLFDSIRQSAESIASKNETTIRFDQYYESPAADTDPAIERIVGEAAGALGLSSLPMPSGAGHDAQSLKEITPLGMIFVPSKDGISHAPTEFTSPQDISNGANVLLKTVLGMDALLQ